MASRTTAKKAAAAPPEGGGDPAADLEPTTTDAGGSSYVLAYDGEDGPVTFSRGDDSHTFEVSEGRISTTKDRAAWLVRYTAARPVAEKE